MSDGNTVEHTAIVEQCQPCSFYIVMEQVVDFMDDATSDDEPTCSPPREDVSTNTDDTSPSHSQTPPVAIEQEDSTDISECSECSGMGGDFSFHDIP